jgi:hypothetical protein
MSGITGWTYNEILAMGVHGAHIVDQNARLVGPYTEYTWLRDSTDPKLRWLWCRSQNPVCPEFSLYAPGSGLAFFDTSDAGMVYWLVTGGLNGGDQGATPAKLKALFTTGGAL